MPKLIRWFVVIKGNKLNRLTMRTFKNQMQAFAIKQLLKYVERPDFVNVSPKNHLQIMGRYVDVVS